MFIFAGGMFSNFSPCFLGSNQGNREEEVEEGVGLLSSWWPIYHNSSLQFSAPMRAAL